MRRSCPIGILLCLALSAFGQSKDGVDTLKTQEINEVTVTAHQSGRVKANTVGNMELISSKELLPDTGERYLSTVLYAFEDYPL